jgi:tellurite resistance protein
MTLIIVLTVVYMLYRIVKWLSSKHEPPKAPEISVRFEISSPQEYGIGSVRYERPSGRPASWYGLGQSVNVQGYDIPGGLIYVGENLLDTYGNDNDACLINPTLRVSLSEPTDRGEEMGYWPQYAQISPSCRGAFLKWLAGGRVDPLTDIGYVFLFFYGLERRLFIDGQRGGVSGPERAEIVMEVTRLVKIYGSNRSFRGYASNFLAMEWVLYRSDTPVPDYLDFNDRYCSEPFQVVLAQYVAAGKPIPADVGLQWMILHPEFGLRTPARRCAKEFRDLFVRRYTQRFGDGLLVKPNKTLLKLEYRAASPSIRGNLKLRVPTLPNPFLLTGPLKKLSTLAEECTVALEPYSRFLGRKDNDPNSLEAVALLPEELMRQAPGSENVRSNLGQICEGNPSLISVEALYQSLGGKVPTQLGKKESESLAGFVEGMGFGMAPDARFHNLKPSPDGKVVIFPNGHGVDFQPSKEFRTVGTILRLGAMVSQIDQGLSPAEEATLQTLIQENPVLTRIEKNSLVAFLLWCLSTPQGTTGLKQRLAEMSTIEKTAISHILISVAHADGRIDPKEVKQLEKLYTTLGLDREQVTSDIHALAASSGPVTVGLRDAETTFSIPKPMTEPGVSKGFRLNEELIRIREEETRQVKGVLEGIFADQGEEHMDNSSTSAMVPPTSNPLAALDEAHQNFFHRLLTQETWERAALHEICKDLGLTIDGAMEVLNEWAFEHANAPLVEDGEPVYVDFNLAREITNG